MRRRRTLRPASRQTLVFVTMLLAFVVWVCWEVGRLRWWRVVTATASGVVLALFALGWIAR